MPGCGGVVLGMFMLVRCRESDSPLAKTCPKEGSVQSNSWGRGGDQPCKEMTNGAYILSRWVLARHPAICER